MKLPEPQAYLSKDAKKIYLEICEHLDSVDALESVDSHGLSMAAHYLHLFRKYADAEPIQTFPNKTQQVSPAFTIMKDAREAFVKLSVKFGLSAKDRDLMLKFKKRKIEKDALDEL